LANTSQGDTTLAARDSTVRLVAVHQRDGRHCVSAAPAGRACDPEARGEADTGRIRCAGRGISYTGTAMLSSSRFPDNAHIRRDECGRLAAKWGGLHRPQRGDGWGSMMVSVRWST
jgi:hypothetical protein